MLGHGWQNSGCRWSALIAAFPFQTAVSAVVFLTAALQTAPLEPRMAAALKEQEELIWVSRPSSFVWNFKIRAVETMNRTQSRQRPSMARRSLQRCCLADFAYRLSVFLSQVSLSRIPVLSKSWGRTETKAFSRFYFGGCACNPRCGSAAAVQLLLHAPGCRVWEPGAEAWGGGG